LKQREYSLTAQALVGAAFSLWRAVFLAEKEGSLGASLVHSIKFLEKIVRTNAIAFPQEMEANEWTFNYYLNNCHYRLRDLQCDRKELMTPWIVAPRGPRERWEYNQEKLNEALGKFSKALESSS
jgi:hypothetical protein